MKRPTFFLLAALLAATAPTAYAQIKYVAVVETELDAQSGADAKMNKAEVRQITAELRSVAVKNLPRDKYNIMTSETVMAQGSAVLEECAEENCVIALGAKIGADYIVRGLVSKLGTSLTLSVEMYETEDGNLVATSGLVRSENVVDLLDKAAAVCAEMYKTFAATQRPAPKTPATQATPAAPATSAAPATPAAPVNYTVTAVANPAYGGTVSRNPNQPHYAPGTNVSITAAPADGYAFTGWSGASTSKNAVLTGPIDRNLTLMANFEKKPALEPKPEPPAPKPEPPAPMPEPPAPMPNAGLAQEPPRKRHTLAALGLDAAGAGVFLYGVAREMNVRDNIKEPTYEWTAAEKSAKQRNAAYIVGSIILLSGISVHIFF